jgi:ribosomal subunit interface protein
MDVVVRGRGGRVDGPTREHLEQKLGRLSRFDGRIDRIEVEVTFEPSDRIHHGHLIEASCRSGRRTYRAHADGTDVLVALDRLIERLERQISDRHRKGRHKASGASSKVQSARMASNEGEPDALT